MAERQTSTHEFASRLLNWQSRLLIYGKVKLFRNNNDTRQAAGEPQVKWWRWKPFTLDSKDVVEYHRCSFRFVSIVIHSPPAGSSETNTRHQQINMWNFPIRQVVFATHNSRLVVVQQAPTGDNAKTKSTKAAPLDRIDRSVDWMASRESSLLRDLRLSLVGGLNVLFLILRNIDWELNGYPSDWRQFPVRLTDWSSEEASSVHFILPLLLRINNLHALQVQSETEEL